MKIKKIATGTILGMVVLVMLAQTTYAVNTWQQSESSLPETRANHGSVIVDNCIYVVGGSEINEGTGTAGVFSAQINNGSVGEWQLSPSGLAVPRARHSLVHYEGYLYVMGGNASGNAQTTVMSAPLGPDCAVGVWQLTTPMPVGHRRHTSVVYQGRVYVIGSSNPARNTVYSAILNSDGTIDADAWDLSSETLPGNIYFHTTILHKDNVYVFGGFNDVDPQGVVWYTKINTDGSLQPWQTNTISLPTTLISAAAFSFEDRVYIAGGIENALGEINATDKMYTAQINEDGSIGAWELYGATLPNSLHLHRIVTAGNYAYLTGGRNQVGENQSGVYVLNMQEVLEQDEDNASLDSSAEQRTLAETGRTNIWYTMIAVFLLIVAAYIPKDKLSKK